MSKKVTMWHATDKEGWEFVQKQQMLIYPRATKDFPDAAPCVYLAHTKADTEGYGDYVLKVRFTPSEWLRTSDTNYRKDVWQCRVYKGIPLKHVTLHEIRKQDK